METTIEGAQKRIAKAIEDYADRCKFIGDPRETNPDLEYIAVFIDTVDSEAAGHLADKIELQKEIDELRKRIDLNAQNKS